MPGRASEPPRAYGTRRRDLLSCQDFSKDLNVLVPELIKRNWVWADFNSPCGALPQWIERVGDLVADGPIVWSTPDDAPFGEVSHDVLSGTCPVFVGVDGYGADDDPGRTRYDVRVVFVAPAGPEKLAAATWRHDQAGLMTIEDYTCLTSEKASGFLTAETSGRLREEVLSAESVHRRGPWPDEVVDPDSRLNVMLFPARDGGSGTSCIELVDEDEELAGLLHFSYGT